MAKTFANIYQSTTINYTVVRTLGGSIMLLVSGSLPQEGLKRQALSHIPYRKIRKWVYSDSERQGINPDSLEQFKLHSPTSTHSWGRGVQIRF